MSPIIVHQKLAFFRSAQNIVLVLTTFATIIYFAYTSINTVTVVRNEREQLDRLENLEKEFAIQKAQLGNAVNDVERNISQLERIIKVTDDKSETARAIIALQTRTDSLNAALSSVNQKLDSLTSAITSTPEKVLALPLLKKDVDDLRAESHIQTEELKDEMNRMYDMNKWLIGLILAALVGTIINNIIQSKKADKTALTD
jgi:septal ring factor EnvC (AmiA/AmiB activator)